MARTGHLAEAGTVTVLQLLVVVAWGDSSESINRCWLVRL